MKKLWVPLLMTCASLAGLVLGRISGKNAAEREINKIDLNQIMGGGYGSSKLQSIMGLIQEMYVDRVDMDSIEEIVIPELLEKLDPHSVYIPKSEVEHVAGELKSNFGGIGVTFSMRDDTVRVMSVIPGGPSAVIGIQPGDRIIKVNHQDFTGKKVNSQMVMDSLRGEIGTQVDVTILRKPSTTIDYKITRGEIPLTSVDCTYQIAPGVGYMKIDRFAEKTYEEMLTGIAKIRSEDCGTLIIDLRGNSGGFLQVVIGMCNEFLEKGQLIVYTEGLHQSRQDTYARGNGTAKDLKLVVLIDEFSASASEILAGAVQDNDRGLIIGRRSFGKGLVQTEMTLPDKSGLRLTVARYHTPSGRCIQKQYGKGKDDYYNDIHERLQNGELFSADSIKADTLQAYKTLNGRTVYGGGGIIPDIFVPYDTLTASGYLQQLRAKRIIYDYAMTYVDEHREELKKMKTDELIRHLFSKSFIGGVEQYAKKRKVTDKDGGAVRDRGVIETEVRAYVAQAIAGNDAFYPILNTLDPVIKRALTELGVEATYKYN